GPARRDRPAASRERAAEDSTRDARHAQGEREGRGLAVRSGPFPGHALQGAVGQAPRHGGRDPRLPARSRRRAQDEGDEVASMHLASWVVLLALGVAGCASTSGSKPASTGGRAEPAASPIVVQILSLAAPAGGRGRLELTRTGAAYRGAGSITVADDLGQWSFSYAPVKPDDPTSRRESLQALGIRLERLSGDA